MRKQCYRSLMSMLLLMMLAACGGGDQPITAAAVSYYIDATAGGDDQSGRSPATAWQSFSNLPTITTAATLYLKRGESWQQPLVIPRSNITVDLYGSGTAPALLDGSALVPAWQVEGVNQYRYTPSLLSGEYLGNLSRDGLMVNFLPWKTDLSTTFSGASFDSFSFDHNSTTLYLYSDNAPAASTFRYSKLATGIVASGVSDISISGVKVSRFSFHGIQLEDCTRCSVRDSEVSRVGGIVLAVGDPGGYGDFLQAGNGIEFGNRSSEGVVEGVTISEVFDSCLTPQTYNSNQQTDNFSFSNLTLSQCGFAGVEISVLSNGGTSGSQIEKISMDNLQISDSGKGWSGRRYGTEGHGIRIKADSSAGSLAAIELTNSHIHHAVGDGVSISGESGVVNISQTRIAHNDGAGVRLADATANTLGLALSSSLIYSNGARGVSVNLTSGAGLSLLHNSFYGDLSGINLGIDNLGSNLQLINNLFAGDITHLYSANPLPGSAIDYNCYQIDAGLPFGYDGFAFIDLATFKAATGFSGHGVTATDLLISDPANGDLSLTTGSACTQAGSIETTITYDFLGNTFANPPARGALQH